MCIKIDKTVWMNFLYSFLGGIFGGMVIAFYLIRTIQKGILYYLELLGVIVGMAVLGILIMGYVNYQWEDMKKRIHKKKDKN